MRLFEVGTDYKVIINKDWILTIPVFRKLVHRDKGSEGDYDGRKKYKALKELTFIYHLIDPRSPLENIDTDSERREKSLQYAELKENDIDSAVLDAQFEYDYLLSISSPSLPLLRAAKRTNIKLINYFDTIDFSKVDMRGQLVHSPMQHIKNVSMLKMLHENTTQFEQIVLNELKEQKGTRGKTELGDKEQNGSRRKWVEGDSPKEPPHENAKTKKAEVERLNTKAPSFLTFSSINEELEKEEEEED